MSYKDSVKDAAREKLRDFIARNLGDPATLKVLCFPGAEEKGEEGLELLLYDSLGIPRRNITGLEYDTEKFARLRDAPTGIEVVCKADFDYFLKADKKWDIISLDYTGPYQSNSDMALLLVAARRLLNDKGVLCTNFLKGRDKDAINILQKSSHIAKAREMIDFIVEGTLDLSYFEEHAKDVVGKRITGSKIQYHRSQFIIRRIINLFENGAFMFMDKATRRKIVEGKFVYADETLLKLEQRMLRKAKNSDNLASIYPVVSLLLKRPYVLEDQESYSYQRRNATSRMFFDMFCFDNYEGYLPEFDDVFSFDKGSNVVSLKDVDFGEVQDRCLDIYAKLKKAKSLASDRVEIKVGRGMRVF